MFDFMSSDEDKIVENMKEVFIMRKKAKEYDALIDIFDVVSDSIPENGGIITIKLNPKPGLCFSLRDQLKKAISIKCDLEECKIDDKKFESKYLWKNESSSDTACQK